MRMTGTRLGNHWGLTTRRLCRWLFEQLEIHSLSIKVRETAWNVGEVTFEYRTG